MRKQIKYLFYFIGFLLIGGYTLAKDDRLFEIVKNIEIFGNLYKEVNTYYVDEVNPTKSMNLAIQSMLKELDPYTVFYPEELIENARLEQSGNYSGVGLQVNSDLDIVEVEIGSSAYEAGIRIGDKLKKINKIELKDLNVQQVNTLFNGERNSTVQVEILPYKSEKSKEFSLIRKENKTKDVGYFSMLDSDIGYIELLKFERSSSSEILTAYTELKEKGMKSLVLDLRSNPGGLLDQAISISNFFIPRGKLVVFTKGKSKNWDKEYFATKEPLDTEIPLVILINNNSASASEIVSGTLQDYDRAVIIGQQSFGKGLVQQYRPLNYNTMAKITVAKYYIPSGRSIQALDYSNRREDGSVVKVADSLKKAYKTLGGRTVYDGAGISPDLTISIKEKSEISQKLISDGVIFNFGTSFSKKRQNLEPDFAINEAIYQDFLNFIKAENYIFKSSSTLSLEKLEVFEDEKEYDSLVQKSRSKDEKAFQVNKIEIFSLLNKEIKRRYPSENSIKKDFSNDKEVEKALSVLKDKKEFDKILKK